MILKHFFVLFVPFIFVNINFALAQGLDAMGEVSLAPIPENAQGQQIDTEKGYFVEEVNDGLYWLTEGTYTTMFLTTGEGVIVVDAPPSIGENILKAIAEVTNEPITHVIYSHSHADHIGAAGIYPEDATIIAHKETAVQLEAAHNPERSFPYGVFSGGGDVPLPEVTFTNRYILQVADQTLILEYRGVNHEPGNIFIYAPNQKTLMLVDVIFPGWVPFAELAIAEDIIGYYDAHDQVLEYDFDTFIGGHMNRTGTREDVETQLAYIQDIQQNAIKALQEVDFMAVAGEVNSDRPWPLFRAYLDTVAQNCADATIPNWIDTLGDVEVWAHSHCWVVALSIQIN